MSWFDDLVGKQLVTAGGALVPQRKRLRVVGATLTDDANADETVLEVTGGGGSLTPPADPTDDGRAAYAAAGDLAYAAGTHVAEGVFVAGATSAEWYGLGPVGVGTLEAHRSSGSAGVFGLIASAAHATAAQGAQLLMMRSRGTRAAPSDVSASDVVGQLTMTARNAGAPAPFFSIVTRAMVVGGSPEGETILAGTGSGSASYYLRLTQTETHVYRTLVLSDAAYQDAGVLQTDASGTVRTSKVLELPGVAGVPSYVPDVGQVAVLDGGWLCVRTSERAWTLTGDFAVTTTDDTVTTMATMPVPSDSVTKVSYEIHAYTASDAEDFAGLNGACFIAICDGSGAVTGTGLGGGAGDGISYPSTSRPAWADASISDGGTATNAVMLSAKPKTGASATVRWRMRVEAIVRLDA